MGIIKKLSMIRQEYIIDKEDLAPWTVRYESNFLIRLYLEYIWLKQILEREDIFGIIIYSIISILKLAVVSLIIFFLIKKYMI